MPPPTNNNTYVPAHRRSSRQNKNRRPSAQAQDQPRPSTHSEDSTSADRPRHAFDFTPPARFPTAFPIIYDDGNANTAPFPNPVPNISSPPSNAPREPLAMRQHHATTASSRGKMKSRTYPELQPQYEAEPPQSKYQQALAYAQCMAKEVTDAVLMTPAGMTLPQDIPVYGHRSQRSLSSSAAKVGPTSPILQKLQEKSAGGYFALNSGDKRVACPQPEHDQGRRGKISDEKEVVSGENSAAHTVQEPERPNQRVDAKIEEVDTQPSSSRAVTSPEQQVLVEAMEGLQLFQGIRPASRQPQFSPHTDTPSREPKSPEAPAEPLAAAPPPADPKEQSADVKHAWEYANLSTAESIAALAQNPTPEKIMEATIAELYEESQKKTRKSVEQPCSSSAIFPEDKPSATAQSEETGGVVVLENVEPEGNASEETSSSDGFEVVEDSDYQSQRIGRPGIWERLVQGKR
ncbi:hypothetical protein BU23DRAFT_151075 [Bimuria novae-zelandiae CBS 107.79]|uniref:Uncharacterized protein n=1 Tax=Bimuria novae-zelandiae CBS 107.79 TaxID=1447943 RepID=A0A6A5VWH8_9PLEO|nr:hypothetical protein BU23DRAFT_151075 [Bimuria novae-zelandiae CBS 107.79]